MIWEFNKNHEVPKSIRNLCFADSRKDVFQAMNRPSRACIALCFVSVAAIVAVGIYFTRLSSSPASNRAIDSLPSVPADMPLANAMAVTLEESFAASAPYERLTETQRRQIIRQAAELLTTYLEANGPEAVLRLVRQWGLQIRMEISAESLADRWPPPDSPDRIVAIDAEAASLQARIDQIVGERDGAPIWELPDLLPEASGAEVRSSVFIDWNEFTGNEGDSGNDRHSHAVVVPVHYANGDRAIVAFWFRWNEELQRWTPWLLRFERENRQFRGAPLF